MNGSMNIEMDTCDMLFEAADGYSVKPPPPERVYKAHLFAQAGLHVQ